MMDFTGERLIPDQQRDDDLLHEHIVRYQFAAQWAAGRRVLDAGCGAGYGAALLAAAGARSVLGVDVAAEAIAYADAHYHLPNLSYRVADVQSFDGEGAAFDLIVSFEVIEHLDDPFALVRTAHRLLAPHGLFVVSTPNVATYPPGNPFHRHELTRDAFHTLLSEVFATVVMYEQDYCTALCVRPEAERPAATWRLTPATRREAQQPDYFIALCAHESADVPERVESIMYELPADRLGQRIADVQTLVRLLDDKNAQLQAKDVHIAQMVSDLRQQGEWAQQMQRRLQALERAWYVRLFGRRTGQR